MTPSIMASLLRYYMMAMHLLKSEFGFVETITSGCFVANATDGAIDSLFLLYLST